MPRRRQICVPRFFDCIEDPEYAEEARRFALTQIYEQMLHRRGLRDIAELFEQTSRAGSAGVELSLRR